MKLEKKEIQNSSALQLSIRLTRLQFDTELEPVCNISAEDKKQIAEIEKELRKRLVKMLGRNPYPPVRKIKPVQQKAEMNYVPPGVKSEAKKDGIIKFNVIVTSSLGSKAADFSVEATSKSEAEIEARKMISKLGLKGAKYKIV